MHTNQTFGALLNATFGNAPELLISTAALRAGFYRVVQLTLLGSILTNLLFVFGCACVVGGSRHKVQELRMTSGNVSIGMLFLSTAGLVLPAALKLSNQAMFTGDGETDVEIQFSRFNSLVMAAMYVGYLFFQLGTHKDEFEDGRHNANLVTVDYLSRPTSALSNPMSRPNSRSATPIRRLLRNTEIASSRSLGGTSVHSHEADGIELTNHDFSLQSRRKSFSDAPPDAGDERNVFRPLPQSLPNHNEPKHIRKRSGSGARSLNGSESGNEIDDNESEVTSSAGAEIIADLERQSLVPQPNRPIKLRNSDGGDGLVPSSETALAQISASKPSVCNEEVLNGAQSGSHEVEMQMTFRSGIVWLFAITLCISAMSDIIVQTIDGFAFKMKLSEVFTALVIVPFFSNIAEQTSAILFAYRNEMDLCVGITVGSAIQISLFVLPGTVLIGWAVDRSMSLFFQGFETCCLLMGVLSVASVLQGGTSNWLTGFFCIGVYCMIAAGFWFHQVEDLSVDEETILHNATTNLRY